MGVRKCLIAVLFVFIIFLPKSVQAQTTAALTDTFPQKTGVDMNKEWKITFSKAVDPASITSSNFKVMDKTRDIGVKVEADKTDAKSVIVELPTLGYVPGKSYTLTISQNVKSQDGKALGKDLTMDFTVSSSMQDGSNYNGLPVITDLDILNNKLTINDKLSINLKASNADKVKYRIYLYKFNYISYTYDFYKELTNGYTNEVSASNAYNFQYGNTLDAGDYKIVAYVKNSSNALGDKADGNTDFDNYYTNYFRCIQGLASDSSKINYKNYNISLNNIISQQYASNSSKYEIKQYWTSASKNIIAYYMNPDNFMDDAGKYMFMRLDQALTNVTADDINAVLKGKGTLEGLGQAFIDASNKYKVNVAYLVFHALQETGNGTTNLASGNLVVSGKKVYNFFGIGAVDESPDTSGAQYAYDNGWFTPEAAVEGGIAFIAQNYIYSTKPIYSDRKTLYTMKWNPSYPASYQYATDVEWAYDISRKIYNLFSTILNKNTISYEVPKYLQ